jgi:hypothetical protein
MVTNWLKKWAAVLAAVTVAACGGGGSDPPSGSGATTAVSLGTVTGFGSVIVDGVAYDDRSAKASVDTEDGAPDDNRGTVEIKLGQRVIVVSSGDDGSARIVTIRVSAEVVGRVTATSPDLVIAGQTVKVNSDPAAGPVTVYEGYGSAADIQVGDRAEVHGVPKTVDGKWVIQASRIERKPSFEAWVRVAGVVSDLASDGKSFKLGGLTVNVGDTTRIAPRGATLADGRRVVVWSTGAQVGNTINASFIRLRVGEQQDATEFRIAGPISECTPPCAGSFKVGGVLVDATGASFVGGSAADLANGKWVGIRGTLDATGTKVAATRVIVRRGEGLPEVSLRGAITDYVDAQNFKVRGVPVTTDASTVIDSSCPSPLANGTLVEVEGRIDDFRVLAKEIECGRAVEGVIVEAKGLVSRLDTTAKTFALPGSLFTGLTLQYGANTVFEDGTEADLKNGAFVEVKGTISGTTVNVTKIEFESVRENLPPGLVIYETEGIASGVARNGGAVTGLTVNGLAFVVDGQTVFVPNVASIVDGVKVKVLFRKDTTSGNNVAVAITLKS